MVELDGVSLVVGVEGVEGELAGDIVGTYLSCRGPSRATPAPATMNITMMPASTDAVIRHHDTENAANT